VDQRLRGRPRKAGRMIEEDLSLRQRRVSLRARQRVARFPPVRVACDGRSRQWARKKSPQAVG
jgi:hypothetical protein